jgi:DNA processing protein
VPGERSQAPLPRGWPEGFGAGGAERRALLVLASLRGIAPRRLRRLAWREGTAVRALARIRAGEAGSRADGGFARAADPDRIGEAVAASGAVLVGPADPAYPPLLLDLGDPPVALFVRGRPLDPTPLHVAVVGSRSATPLGREVAWAIGRRLGEVGACVVSGAARGIDASSHEGALAAHGRTVAVLGSGIDVAYPASSRALIERIAEVGTVVSEHPPGTPAEPHHFPARNRIVVGLSRAVVVVEGAERSGSMTSVTHALSVGREVFAIPGSVASPLSAGPLRLIREGARMIRGPDDLLEDLGFDPSSLAEGALATLPDHDRRLLDALAGPTLPEAVARVTGLPLPAALGALMRLEMRGLVRNLGGRFEPTFASTRGAAGDA